MRTCQKTVLLLVLLLLSGPAFAAKPPEKFKFTKILEYSGPGVFGGGSLNDQGTAAVTVSTFGVGDAVLVGDGRTLSIVAETASVGSFGQAAITNRGDVIFSADSREGRRILLSRKGRLSTLVDVDAPFGVFGDAVVNGRGTIAYHSFLPEVGLHAVVALDHGEVAVIATYLRPIVPFDINQRGQVLSMTDPGRPTLSVLIVGDGRMTRIAAAAADLEGGFFLGAVINDRGTVAFSAFLGERGRRIYLADPQGGLTPAITDDGPFESFTLGGLTPSGTPVFTASLDTGGIGVFFGPDPVADKVIATGDTLDGATVARASVADINASGQLLIWVSFENAPTALYRTKHGGIH